MLETGSWRAGALGLLLGAALSGAAGAQMAERLGPADARTTPNPLIPPASAATDPWAERVQLIYSAETRQLERRAYRARRAGHEAGLIFDWTPRDIGTDRPGPVTGDGRLVWRLPGSASYDAAAIVALYEGAMKDGLRHGHGIYRHRSGFTYEGDWQDGEMHGQGLVALAGGDHYAGGFRAGQLDGFGRYIQADGTVHEGWYRDGVRHGLGTVSLGRAQAFRATWQGGQEITGSREVLDPGLLHKVQSARDVRVAITIDPLSTGDNPQFGSEGPSTYRSFATGETLMIEPSSERIMGVWRGRLPIQLNDGEEIAVENGGGFLGNKPETIRPVALIFEFENRSSRALRVVDTVLEVSESVTDREPMLQIARGPDNECYNTRPFYDPGFTLMNYGWGAAENTEVSMRIVDSDGHPVGPEILRRTGTVENAASLDFAGELEQQGVDTRQMRRGFDCPAPRGSDYDAIQDAIRYCFQGLKSSGAFGPYASAIYPGSSRIFANVAGMVRHNWRDAGGQVRSRSVPFETKLSLGEFRLSLAECGEGGEIQDPNARPFRFKNDARNYRIRLGIRDQVPAGVTARWRIRLIADRASNNRFRLAFSLSDGSIVRSRPVDFLFFRPRDL